MLRTFVRIFGQTMPCLCFGVGREPHRQSRGYVADNQLVCRDMAQTNKQQ